MSVHSLSILVHFDLFATSTCHEHREKTGSALTAHVLRGMDAHLKKKLDHPVPSRRVDLSIISIGIYRVGRMQLGIQGS